MRKHIATSLLITAALTLSLTSCQREEVLSNGSLQDVSISVLVPDNQLVKSANDPGDASGINRCILEIYDSEGQLVGSRQYASVSAKSASFTASLVTGASYDFVFWADHVEDATSGLETDLYYNTADLTNITLSGDYDNNNDNRDAFYASKSQAAEADMSFTLTRPFGQVKVITTSGLDTDLSSGKVKVSFANAPSSFNAVEGTLGEGTAALAPADFTGFASLTGDTEGVRTLSFDYIFAVPESSGQTLVDITFETEGVTGLTEPIEATNVPVQRNWRTNVKGNIIPESQATDHNFNVSLEPGFDNDQDSPIGGGSEEPGPENPNAVQADFTSLLPNNCLYEYYGTLESTNHKYVLKLSDENIQEAFYIEVYAENGDNTGIPAGEYSSSETEDQAGTFYLANSSIYGSYGASILCDITSGTLTVNADGSIKLVAVTDEETPRTITFTYNGEFPAINDKSNANNPDPNFPGGTLGNPSVTINYTYIDHAGGFSDFNIGINDYNSTGLYISFSIFSKYYGDRKLPDGTYQFSSETAIENTFGSGSYGDANIANNKQGGISTPILGGSVTIQEGLFSGELIVQGNVTYTFENVSVSIFNGAADAPVTK